MNKLEINNSSTGPFSSYISSLGRRNSYSALVDIREFKPSDLAGVQKICHEHFRSLTYPAVLFWICQHVVDLCAILIIISIFMTFKELIIAVLVFFVYLFCRSRWEMECYIRYDCPDLKDINTTYMTDSKMHFWVAELLDTPNEDSRGSERGKLRDDERNKYYTSKAVDCIEKKKNLDKEEKKDASAAPVTNTFSDICTSNLLHKGRSEISISSSVGEKETSLDEEGKERKERKESSRASVEATSENELNLKEKKWKEKSEHEDEKEKRGRNDGDRTWSNSSDISISAETDTKNLCGINKNLGNNENNNIKKQPIKLLGCIGLAPHKDDKRVAQLVRLVVSHESRRMRIGSRLLLQLENYAKDMGYREIRLYTNNLSTTPLKFVRQNGYVLIQVVRRGLMRGDLLVWRKYLVSQDSLKFSTARLESKVSDVLD